jgi:hypothetical protein
MMMSIDFAFTFIFLLCYNLVVFVIFTVNDRFDLTRSSCGVVISHKWGLQDTWIRTVMLVIYTEELSNLKLHA